MTTENRLKKLEREVARAKWVNRWLLIVAAVAVLGTAGLAAWPFGPRAALAQARRAGLKTVRANQFVLEDQDGKTRGTLAMGKEGPCLKLYDENGKSRAELFPMKLGASLLLRDAKGNPRVILHDLKVWQSLDLCYEGGLSALNLTVRPQGASVSLRDKDAKIIWSAPR